MKDMFTSGEFKNDYNFCRYLGYTNDNVTMWNEYIRVLLFPTTDIIVEGDLLTGYKNIIDVNNAPVLTNSTDYVVTKAERRMTDDQFIAYNTTLVEVGTGRIVKISIVDHTDPSFANYVDILDRLHMRALTVRGTERGMAWKRYYAYKDLHICMITFGFKSPNGSTRAWATKDIYYGYGLTVHKSQGSTIKNVVLDGLDIVCYNNNTATPRRNTSNNPDALQMRNRLLYTGLTRVKQVAHIIF
jgi:exodeoxyribonuclease-5